MLKLAPSILSADFMHLGEDIAAADRAGAHYIHIDVMDGHYVPNISFGFPVIASIRPCTKKVFDVHLMVDEPIRYLRNCAQAGADIVTVHAEACTHLHRTLQEIHGLGMKAGVALNPATPPDVVEYVLDDVDMILLMTVNPGFGGQSYIPAVGDKIRYLRSLLTKRGQMTDIEVDGGINTKNLGDVLRAGANVIVAGSKIFEGSIEDNTRAFLEGFQRFEDERQMQDGDLSV